MSKLRDLTGLVFGKLTVLKRSDARSSCGKVLWICKCDCGNEATVIGESLKSGCTGSCGCNWRSGNNLIGMRFGKLVVVSKNQKMIRCGFAWNCVCDCGNRVVAEAISMRRGDKKSCGCISISDLTGKRFGMLIATKLAPKDGRYVKWVCDCDCGNTCVIASGHLTRKVKPTSSCGCLNATRMGISNTVEGMTYARMFARCNCKGVNFKSYGAIGIDVCERWRMSFQAFMEDMGHRPPDKTSIDRIDSLKGYGPDNCRWATAKEQNRNKRNNVLLAYRGKTQCLSAWAEECGISRKVVRDRLECGWSVEKALETPVQKRRNNAK